MVGLQGLFVSAFSCVLLIDRLCFGAEHAAGVAGEPCAVSPGPSRSGKNITVTLFCEAFDGRTSDTVQREPLSSQADEKKSVYGCSRVLL